MTVSLDALVALADRWLSPRSFKDYCPNGLQVQGRPRVAKLVSGVTASQALIDAAIAAGADALLVHHGLFWSGDDPCVVGMKRARLAALLANDISLLAYHLPLDAHPELGNNAQLALRLGVAVDGGLQAVERPIGNVGMLPRAEPLDAFGARVGRLLGRSPLLVAGGEHPIRRLAFCTGGAQSYIEQAVALGVDAYLTGEVSEQTVHIARESGIHFIAAGHHATERYGAPALGEALARELGIAHQFIDIDNPA